MNKQTERMNMREILKARFILQRRTGNVADSFLAFRTQQEAEAYRRAMQADQFEVVELLPDVWLDACRGFLQEGLTYISHPELDGDTVVKKSVRLGDKIQ